MGGRAGITVRTALVEPSGGRGLCGGGGAGGMDVLLAWGCVSQRQPGGMKIALIADTEKDLRLLASKVAYVISHVTQIQVPYYRKVMVFTVISLKKLTCNDMSTSSTLLIDFFPPKKPQLF